MMAEPEVTKEVSKTVQIDEKCGFDMNSYQDPPKPQCNGTNHYNEANDPGNSYVFVTGANGLPDDAVHNKDVAAEDLSVSSESKASAIDDLGAELDSQNEKLNAVAGEVNESLNKGENGSVEWSNDDRPGVNDSTQKQESSLEDGERVQDSVVESLNKGENGSVEWSNEDQPGVNDSTWKQESSLEDGNWVQDSVADSLEEHTGNFGNLTEGEVKQVENPGGKAESLGEAEVEKAGDQSGTIEGVAEGESEKLDNLITSESPPGPVPNQESEVSGNNCSAISSGEKTDDVIVTCRTEALDSFNINEDGADNIVEIEDVEEKADQLDGSAGSSNENLSLQQNEESGNSHGNNISVASPEGSSANMINGEEASIKTKTKPFNLLIRVPRFDDESLREQIRLAKLHVDEKTKLRDAIQVQIQEIRANSQIHGTDYEYAKQEGRGARKLVRSKRMEIDSLQSVINKAKNALSIEDIDSQMHNMEHMIQHETLPLKEEKQLIREIKQLKQLREQLSSNMGSQDEIKQALEQREEVEERLKILRKELDILKGRVLKAEAVAMEAEKKYDHENTKVKELQSQFRAADAVRQAAYAQWQSLRKELLKKSKHFFKYKDDAAAASNYAFSRDSEALYRLCTNHVDNFMELWNTNDEFRREYVKFNARSTVRRFGTLDGRSLGPDEEPPILSGYVDDRANRMVSIPVKADLASQVPPPDLKRETTVENVTLDGKSTIEVTEHKNQKVTKKGPAVTIQMNGLDTVSRMDITDEVDEEPKKSKEETEEIRKAEELRREEAEAELREQRRLEELAKAKEARERKKRQAEKLQKREELKAQKEAEEKEKEKERRLRKKERKKAAATDVNDIKSNTEPPPSSESVEEISKDIEVKDTSSMKAKKAQKTWFAKQNKTKSVPPPLRNRNKKKWQQWMWVAITSLIIFVLFWLGNIGLFSKVNFRQRSPIH